MLGSHYLYIKKYQYQPLLKRKSHKKDMFLLALGLLFGVFLTQQSNTTVPKQIISPLSAQSEEVVQVLTPTPTPTPTIFVIPTNTPTPTKIETKHHTAEKSNYTIAILGDSMIDTAGKGYPILTDKLKAVFPSINFTILNYGVGAKDLEYGLQRLTNDYEYLGERVPSLLSQNPDIIIVESFAYNHWSKSQSDLDKQWLTLAKIVDIIKSRSQAKIAFLATIAPNSQVYGKGIKDINWSEEERLDNSETVKLYLQNHINFTNSQKIPIIDAYHPSLDQNNQGKIEFINQGDFLHPSLEGHDLVADLITSWLKENL